MGIDVLKLSSVDWKPSPAIALATSADDSRVAVAREDGSLEIWLVSPGSVGWHCQLTIHGEPKSRVSSLVWYSQGDSSGGRLLSSSIDGSVSEWDLFDLKQKVVLDSIGVSIWQMAVAPMKGCQGEKELEENESNVYLNGKNNGVENQESSSEDDDADDSVELNKISTFGNPYIALACDDGCVRLYTITESDELIYFKSLPRVKGRILSVTWSPDGKLLYCGSSDGFIRCWDVNSSCEMHSIPVEIPGSRGGPELCVWALLALRNGTLVSGDSSGSVQFWDCRHGTLLQAHSLHKGDVNALAAVPSHKRVFSAGSDGQVVHYKLSSNAIGSGDNISSSGIMKKWVHVGQVRAHSHDVRALTIAVPICREDISSNEKVKRQRTSTKPMEFSYHKWAHLGVPMLISAGDDTKLFAYSANEFSKFSPHDICPAPQRVPIQLVPSSSIDQEYLLLVQAHYHLDILRLRVRAGSFQNKTYGRSGGTAATALLAQIKSKSKIICSAISASGAFVAYSDHKKVKMIEFKKSVEGKTALKKKEANILQGPPNAHTMIFTSDSSQLMVAGQDRRIYVVSAKSSDLVHIFTPRRVEQMESLPPSEPPITKLFASSDGQWLAAINCFGDIYIFNLETQRQHWFIARLDGASVTAGGFSPQNSNVLVLTTSSNQVYAFDVEAKQLGKWSMQHTFVLPKRFRDFPGEVVGLSFSPKSSSSTVLVYSARTTCSIDFEMPVDQADCARAVNDLDSTPKSCIKLPINGMKKRKLKDFVLPTEGKNDLEVARDMDYFPFKDNDRYSASKWLHQPPTAGKVLHKRTHTLEHKACNLHTEDRKTFGMSINQEDRPSMANGCLENGKQEGKSKDCDLRTDGSRKNFDFTYFRDPILFLAHLSTDCVLVIDKPWMEVVKSFDTQPVHRHIYGT